MRNSARVPLLAHEGDRAINIFDHDDAPLQRDKPRFSVQRRLKAFAAEREEHHDNFEAQTRKRGLWPLARQSAVRHEGSTHKPWELIDDTTKLTTSLPDHPHASKHQEGTRAQRGRKPLLSFRPNCHPTGNCARIFHVRWTSLRCCAVRAGGTGRSEGAHVSEPPHRRPQKN